MKDGAWIGWLLIIAGWVLVNHTNNKRETRKEARAAIDQAKKETLSIAKNAISYFGDVTSKLGDEIKNSLELLEVEFERLKGFANSELATRFFDFHERCTGADFESQSRKVHDSGSAHVQDVLLARNRLIQQLEVHFRKKYLRGVI